MKKDKYYCIYCGDLLEVIVIVTADGGDRQAFVCDNNDPFRECSLYGLLSTVYDIKRKED